MYLEALHAGRRLLQARQEDRGRPGVRHQEGEKKLRRYVESHDHAIRLKAEIMVEHFHEQVIARAKSAARPARWSSRAALSARYNISTPSSPICGAQKPYQAIVAFSGEHEYGGTKVTEASLNGFPSGDIADQNPGRSVPFSDLRRQVPDRLRRAAVHTMYVDKALSGIKAVQTLVTPQSRPSAKA